MKLKATLSAREALEKLKEGNSVYLNAHKNEGDISPDIRKHTLENGQAPYAVILACSDSRVIPENIFHVGIGDLFVIRVAGNVMDKHQMGSIEYALHHLGTRLIVVLGHEKCGAVHAALQGGGEGYIRHITDEIREAIGDEKDPKRACVKNVERSVQKIREAITDIPDLLVTGALYYLRDGHVEFLDKE